MRSRFALASAALAFLVLPAGAFDRHDIQPGDTVLGTALVAGTFNEYTVLAARGSVLSMTITKSGPGNYVPALGLYDDEYSAYGAVQTGPSSVLSAPLASSQYRILVGSRGSTVGGYRLKTSVRPAKRFAVAGTAAAPVTTMAYGAYPGFDATVVLKWKGPAPVTLTSVAGPDGSPVTSAETPRTTASTFTQAGYHAALRGDYVVTVDAPAGTVKWSVTVQLSGSLTRGTTRDFRVTTPPERATVTFPSAGRAPVVAVSGETGGPNQCVLSATGGVPDASFLDNGAGTGGCSRAVRDSAVPPTTYLLYCVDGFFTDITHVERDGTGNISRYEAPHIRTPTGSGSATLSDFSYDAAGHPTGWTEIRRFDATGRSHELVFTRAEYFANGYCKAFRVVERLLPDGVPRTYDYAPFN